MTLFELCNEIAIQPEIKTRVFDFANRFDFNTVDKQLKDFLIYDSVKNKFFIRKIIFIWQYLAI